MGAGGIAEAGSSDEDGWVGASSCDVGGFRVALTETVSPVAGLWILGFMTKSKKPFSVRTNFYAVQMGAVIESRSMSGARE